MSVPSNVAEYPDYPDNPAPTPDAVHEAEVVAEHLPEGYSAEFDGALPSAGPSSPAVGATADDSSDPAVEDSSLKLQGGDIHRDMFKTVHRIRMHKRASTFHYTRPDDSLIDDDDLSVSNQMAPGGFRRAFIHQHRREQIWAERVPVTRNFVEFLDLYGSFAGEDLNDSDADEAITEDGDDEDHQGPSETRPLLKRRRSVRAPKGATASTTKTFFTLLKAFIGTGIMFLPKAFNNGGILFSSMTLLLVSTVTMLAFHLLLQCKSKYGGGYGEIGQAIAGDKMRTTILASITLSQLGFVCAGIVFVAENLTSFGQAINQGSSPLGAMSLILIQCIVLIPLAWIRNIAKLGPIALLADVFILIGVGYIFWYDISGLATDGLHPSVVLFNSDSYTLTVGAAIFTFEGIGLILPIQSSMAKPERFEWLLAIVMLLITMLFTAVGALCYATFGSDTRIEIIDNFPQTSKLVNAVQFLYSLAVLAGNPVQLFPALRIIEGKIFGSRSGKRNLRTKWTKNAFRAFIVAICGAISIIGASSLDRFVALIGSFACVPLVYIYPALLHYQGVATTWYAKVGDIVFVVLGLVCMVYTTTITVANSFM